MKPKKKVGRLKYRNKEEVKNIMFWLEKDISKLKNTLL